MTWRDVDAMLRTTAEALMVGGIVVCLFGEQGCSPVDCQPLGAIVHVILT